MKHEEIIEFYKSLSKIEKILLDLAVIKTTNFDATILQYMANIVNLTVSSSTVRTALHLFFRRGIIQKSYYYYGQFDMDSSAFLHIIPLIENNKALINTKFSIPESPHSHFNSKGPMDKLKSVLRELLFGKTESYRNLEEEYFQCHNNHAVTIYKQIIEDPAYYPYLNKISSPLVADIIFQKVKHNQFLFTPITSTKCYFEKIKWYLKDKQFPSFFSKLEDFQKGNFTEIENMPFPEENSFYPHYFSAIKYLSQDLVDEALKSFETGLREQRKIFKNKHLPSEAYLAFCYISALTRVESSVSSPIFSRILKSLENSSSAHDSIFKILINFILGVDLNKENIYHFMIELLYLDNTNSWIGILVYYLCNFEFTDKTALKKIQSKVNEIDQAGYSTFALEAAYALQKIPGAGFPKKQYDNIAAKVKNAPFISKIPRTEEWERALNMLLSMQSKSHNSIKESASSRIAYFYDPQHNTIQPILQNRQVKGWSKGRILSLKSLFEGKVENMTEQDLRISKTIIRNRYHHLEYNFLETVLVELIGHPYIFLDGSKDTPVEFLKGKPLIRVEKSGDNYALNALILNFNPKNNIHIEKETNTRFHIYQFTDKQLDMLRIISQKKIVVPESGKEKLGKLLGVLSEESMDVHSDLMTANDTDSNIENIAADSRIRVQLLPFGDGLKAELYSKPFGEFPPYCKPGRGGAMLIRNSQNTQFQVKRDLELEQKYEAILMDDIQSLESLEIQDRLIAFHDPMDSLYLLDILKEHREICVIEWPEGERFKIAGKASFDNLKLSLKSKNNWFELNGELTVNEDTVLSLQQLLSLTEKGHGRFVELTDGQFLALTHDLKKQLDELRSFSASSKKGVAINQFATLALENFFENIKSLKVDKNWKSFQQQIKNSKSDEIAVPSTLQAELRPYQEDGFRWMTRLAQWNAGACLADDMGLGKTIQSLTILLHRANQGAALVVCPVSVMGNWINEAKRFAPSLNIKTLANTNRKETLSKLQPGDVLITSYGLIQSEDELFSQPEFASIILDEAHAIKNFNTKTSKAIMQLKGYFRLALTGTPIQNHVGEVWNLFNFINPGLLGSLTQFTDRFVKPSTESAKKQLKKLITPFILRRTKTTVLEELPPKTEIVKKIQLSDAEMAFYEALRREALENISNNNEKNGTKHLQVLAEITKLRQACCNPKLVDSNLNIPSAKLSTFLEIVDELTANNHRTLVFSQFVTHLAIVREELDKRKISYQYLDGSTSIAKREQSVNAFQNGEGQLFLISLKAGGLGLNLTAADYVVHLDPWWNPAVEDQASDRAHRIGQQRPVTIYRLVAENTIEEKILQLHDTKRDLAESLLEGSDQSARLSMKELVELIKEEW